MAESGARATYLGKVYQQQYAYNAETSYVAGEFYWQVERGQKTFNRDFANGSAPAVDGALGQRADLVVRQPDRQRRGRGRPSSSTTRRTCSSAATRCRVSAASSLGCGTIVLIVRGDHRAADHPEHLQQRGRLRRLAQRGRLVRRLFEWRRPQVT